MGIPAAKFWTVAEVDSLPDDGNKYEVIDGELFVTPSPTLYHEHVAARLVRLLDRFVEAHGLGVVFSGRPAVRAPASSVEPDLLVAQPPEDPGARWEDAPTPILVVEVHSPRTRRRDQLQKRDFYMRRGIPEYWMVDPVRRSITQVRAGQRDVTTSDTITWRPPGTSAELTFAVGRIFGPK